MAEATKGKKRSSAGARKSKAEEDAGSEIETSTPAAAGAAANAALASQAALAGTRAAGKAVTLVAARARVPLAVGGGLAAGVAGGLTVLRRGRRRRSGFDIASAAERVGALGEEVGRVAIVIQRAADGKK